MSVTRDDFNSVRLIGRLGRDVEIRYTPSGTAVASVSIAVGGGKKKDGSSYPTHWIDIKAFGETAEAMAETLSKGSGMRLKGEIQQEKWTDKEGNNRSKLVVVVREFEKEGKKATSGDDEILW